MLPSLECPCRCSLQSRGRLFISSLQCYLILHPSFQQKAVGALGKPALQGLPCTTGPSLSNPSRPRGAPTAHLAFPVDFAADFSQSTSHS